jgi:dienelactone hydrolase
MCRLLCLALILLLPCALAAPKSSIEKGTFVFEPLDAPGASATPDAQENIPERYRLKKQTFRYEIEHKLDIPAIDVTVSRVRFPSPYKSPDVVNNTVHAEYYRPVGKTKVPAVIILDITGGDQKLSRYMGAYLASEGIAGLFVQMAYYGPRRPKGSKKRLLSTDLKLTTAAVTQTVQDLRVAAAWLASREEIDPKRLGIVGTSLGSFLAALTGEMEPRLGRVCVLLGGGGFVDGYAEHPLGKPFFSLFALVGGNRDGIKKMIAPIDPITCAANLKNRKLLILAASNDEVVPPKMATMLWEASGKQEIVWYPLGHYTALLSAPDAFGRMVKFFAAP